MKNSVILTFHVTKKQTSLNKQLLPAYHSNPSPSLKSSISSGNPPETTGPRPSLVLHLYFRLHVLTLLVLVFATLTTPKPWYTHFSNPSHSSIVKLSRLRFGYNRTPSSPTSHRSLTITLLPSLPSEQQTSSLNHLFFASPNLNTTQEALY